MLPREFHVDWFALPSEKHEQTAWAAGFKAVSEKGLNLDHPSFLPPDHAYGAARDANRPEADAVIISCTNFRSLEVIEKLEQELGKPVISSNTASMWKLLQLAGVKDKAAGAGRLFHD